MSFAYTAWFMLANGNNSSLIGAGGVPLVFTINTN